MTISATPSGPAAGPSPSGRALIFGLLSGPVAWTVYFLVGYLVAEAGCYVAGWRQEVAGLPLIAVIVMALALPALAVTLYVAYRSYGNWREMGGEDVEALEVTRFLTLSGVLLNLFFTLAILFIIIPMFFIDPCRWV